MTSTAIRRSLFTVGVITLVCGGIALFQNRPSTADKASPQDDPNRLTRPEQECDDHLTNKEYDKALDTATAALEANPKNVAFYVLRGRAFLGQSKYEEALRDFDKGVELAPFVADGHYWRAEVLARQGQR